MTNPQLLLNQLSKRSKRKIEEEEEEEEEVELSSEKQITSFVFLLADNPIEVNVVATIDEENKTITAVMPPGTEINGLLPEIEISAQATVDRTSVQDFTKL